MQFKNDFVQALVKEIALRKPYLENEIIKTIYFGGGTPSLLSQEELKLIFENIYTNFDIAENAEITLETNPDDITDAALAAWKGTGINRLSIGIQSFFEEDLQWMNRAHNAVQAKQSIVLAQSQGFDNITIDLIYGTPTLSNEKWMKNVETAISLQIPHLSCYALTVEPKTALQKLIDQKKLANVDHDVQSAQFLDLMKWAADAGYEHYEISNFAKPGFRSRHNSSYWSGEKYLGLGPSAHSFDGHSRQWNIANNALYVKNIETGIPLFEKEELTIIEQLNEYIMTALRTTEGLNLNVLKNKFGDQYYQHVIAEIQKFTITGKAIMYNENIVLTQEGKLFADGIAADLFVV